MKRRDFLKNGVISMAALKLGEVTLLSPTQTNASELETFQDFDTLAKNIKDVEKVPSVCLNCSTICGMNVLVKDGKIL